MNKEELQYMLYLMKKIDNNLMRGCSQVDQSIIDDARQYLIASISVLESAIFES